MTFDQALILLILAVAFGMFAWGRWRYDIVAFSALMVAALFGVVPASNVFNGFGHPATITVAAILVLSRALTNAGVIDGLAKHLSHAARGPVMHVGSLSGAAALLSTVMNNVGALALLMPVAVQTAAKAGRSQALVLMPVAFASILGGLVTMIGTPPNIIIATFRMETVGEPFGMFDFTPVGLAVAGVGTVLITLVGWRLLPERVPAGKTGGLFNIDAYVTEARVLKKSAAWGMTLAALEEKAAEHEVLLVSLIRRKRRVFSPPPDETLKTYDTLLVEGGPEKIDGFVSALGLRIVGYKADDEEKHPLMAHGAEAMEAVVTPRSRMEGRRVDSLRLSPRWCVRLLAVSRQGRPYRGRLQSFRCRAGDTVLLHGEPDRLAEVVRHMGCLPLADRAISIGKRGMALTTVSVFGAAILASALGLVAFPIALGLATLAVVAANVVPPREIYETVDWPVIVLLGSLIPMGHALQSTGTTDLLTTVLFNASEGSDPWVQMARLMILTVGLSAVLNNAATAVVMAPLAVGIAERLSVSPDPFLMAVAVGASCAFLTPVGHQNNTLVMGPGGYRFADYLRLGGPLTVAAMATALPLIPMIWPFDG